MNEFAESLIRKAEKTWNIFEGDYVGENNFYYCGKCHTQKQTIFTGLGDERLVPCLCECEVAERDAKEKARKLREKVVRLRQAGFSERVMTNWTFANDDGSNPRMTNAMKNFVENFQTFKEEGKGLLLFGTVGTGKTYLAACVANALIDKGIPCLVTNFARIANDVQGMFEGKQQYYDRLNSFPLLVIDDLSAERKTEYMQEIVFNVIDARYRANLPLIVTTNLTREELMHPSDITYQRIFSRLFEMCTPIEVSGKDRRQTALRENIGKTKSILGLE